MAIHHVVQVIDTYAVIKDKSLREIYIDSPWWPHHSPIGNAVVADVVANAIEVQ